MMNFQEQIIEARDTLMNELKKELLGPGSEVSIPDDEHEIITDLPEVRYSIGILFPQNTKMDVNNDDTAKESECLNQEEIENLDELEQDIVTDQVEDKVKKNESIIQDIDDDTLDEDIGLASQNLPASMGMTFYVSGDASKINVDFSFGTYRKTVIDDCKVEMLAEDSLNIPESLQPYVVATENSNVLMFRQKFTKKDIYRIYEADKIDDIIFRDYLYRLCDQLGQRGYIREPHNEQIEIIFDEKGTYKSPEIDGTKLIVKAYKKKCNDGLFAITIMLINTNKGRYKGINSVFQPIIKISTENNTSIMFEQYANRLYSSELDFEEQSLDLLYRDKKVYATGHGTAINWKIKDGIGSLNSTFFPVEMVPQIEFDLMDEDIDPNALSMKKLSDLDSGSRDLKISGLNSLVNTYCIWIDNIEKMTQTLEVRYKNTGLRHVADCKETCERMRVGIELLTNDSNAYTSFLLANRAMFMQRIHLIKQKEDKYPDDDILQEEMRKLNYITEEDRFKWRPFQIAFLLINLNSIVDDKATERNIVDLIWFPTGGGKTEAYLGLTAFTIFYRRLMYPKQAEGTAVIMRYTLRLLAAQQFLRASTLICACESIRLDCEKSQKYAKYSLGKENITIGLWIGSAHIPNKNTVAKEFYDELVKVTTRNIREIKDKNNKFQVLKCPWCGTKMVRDLSNDGKKLIGQWGYRFKNDKQFYLSCPQEGCEFNNALPLQIVDEELYRKPPTLLFGTVDKFAMLPWNNDIGSFFATNTDNRTPELIIQDELHLISGPLGTMVGLYETAIDCLCSAKGVAPKIIASTATIRRAHDQCSSLYNREVKQFPAQGIDSNDSFFAREAKGPDAPGRMYIGVMPSGKTKAMMEIRAIAALLQRTYIMECSDEIKDKFWTVAVYFNSLRDLAKCSNLVDDDIKDFIRRTAIRFGMKNRVRPIGSASELTSRVSTAVLNETLDKLENCCYSIKNQEEKKYPINVLLATNMISVGVDVARLNLMVLVGQPKLTSEYIQASSRIGRNFPGIALVLYDGTKSRDRSHYEQFKAYHEAFYKYVEPTGVTPFSKPARDRALHAIMVSMMRHLHSIAGDNDAKYFDKELKAIEEINNYIVNRFQEIRNRSNFKLDDETEEILKEMENFWGEWQEKVDYANDKLCYGYKYIVSSPPEGSHRLLKAFGSGGYDYAKETLLSMRNVDSSVAANMLVWGDE